VAVAALEHGGNLAHQSSHLQGTHGVFPTFVALDPGPLQSLLQGIGGDDPENDRHAGTKSCRRNALGDLRCHIVEVGSLPANHCPQADDGVITARLGQLVGQQRHLKTARHPVVVHLLALRADIHTMPLQRVLAPF